MTISYDGTNYCGWQVQKNGVSVQSTIQKTLEKVFGAKPPVTGCSRTDSGVHALNYCCTFSIDTDLELFVIKKAINHHLPKDICLKDIKEVDMEFHPRYHCVSKEYTYKIWYAPYNNVFSEKYSYRVNKKPNIDIMRSCAAAFLGTHEFDSFMANRSKIVDTKRTIYYIDIEDDGETIEIKISADGFLYKMVRMIVGTLLKASRENLSPIDIKNIILSKNNQNAGDTAPAKGLFLSKVVYEKE